MDDGAGPNHGVANAPWVYRVLINTCSELSLVYARKENVSNSRPIWLKRYGHVGERAHHDYFRL